MKKFVVCLLTLTLLLAGCGGEEKETVTVDVQQLYTQLEAVGMPEMVQIGEDMMLSLYGIKAEDVKQAKVAVCADGLRADEIWLIEAVDGDAAQRIKSLADNRVSQKDAESITYSPEQNAIVKESVILVEGNYVFFLCSPDVEEMQTIVSDALGK